MNKAHRDELLELLRASAENDQKAFRQLYDLTHKKIHFFVCRILNDTQLAEDVVVETYTAVWKSANHFKGQSKVQTWMFGIARNLAMNKLKKKRPEHTLEDFPHLTTDGGLDIARMDRKAVIAKGMLQLSAKHREVLDLSFLQGFKYSEMADILGVSVNTVKTRVFHAKKALHQCIEKMGVKKDDLYP